mmetsp:Transcript_29581/g.44026  ORF Transcript_29581/g.44026 Transcript_29581/m.44026 type:complete len:158 (-) Transcript_29581:178-651(-)
MKSVAVLLSSVVASPICVSAWLSTSIIHAPLHKRTTLQKARLDDSDESDLIEFYRNSLEKTYTASGFSEEPEVFLHDKEDDLRLHLDDLVVLSTATVYDCDWFEACSPRIEDFEQCDIPDDFKILSSSNTVDIMGFLGIRRAEPLRVEQKNEYRDWD